MISFHFSQRIIIQFQCGFKDLLKINNQCHPYETKNAVMKKIVTNIALLKP